MNENLNAPWLFVIDTENYAGNFERELCAYITGRVGECGVGDDMAELFKQEVGEPFENVVEEGDEHGCYRPATIYPSLGWYNDGMGGHYKEGQEAEALINYRKNAAAHHRGNGLGIQYLKRWRAGDREGLIKAGWDEESLVKSAAEDEAKAVKAEKTTKLGKYPAYNSVAISFGKKPTEKQIALMKKRAQLFAEMKCEYSNNPRISKITGFRLIENKVKRTQRSKRV